MWAPLLDIPCSSQNRNIVARRLDVGQTRANLHGLLGMSGSFGRTGQRRLIGSVMLQISSKLDHKNLLREKPTMYVNIWGEVLTMGTSYMLIFNIVRRHRKYDDYIPMESSGYGGRALFLVLRLNIESA
ncbi:uncharacterized protein EV420DRAFT_1478079 [Desarmillaria tabescens]|uniref:Uncharacterized protein n=1 Tax=Armillaria tabescens TaxID=1929756 RepID=A0AA39N947_ARMTA|nr:uncharacterized protein EV420DRAFT_1478079 [Desarmillaria tabescens]KAK0461298.1 hypothetical protein EV420DRAFT_1478079 [Desarmillaria tabescens]